ncbi:hypothetical protein G6F56_014474 [Rhizopus delemar]|nr:hypothetical protein G6F56_014474 [Rhizopus delemar]
MGQASGTASKAGAPSRTQASTANGTVAMAVCHGIMSAPSRTWRLPRSWMMLHAHANEAPSSITSPITVCACHGLKAGATITPMPA